MSLVAKRGGEILRRLPPGACSGAEVGVFDGRLSEYLLRKRADLRLFMIDRWSKVPPDHSYARSEAQMAELKGYEWAVIEEHARRAVAPYGDRAVPMKSESHEAAREFAIGSLDFVFIDADHCYEAVAADIDAWLAKVKPGGYLCGHDWDHPEDHIGAEERKWGVKEAVLNSFCEEDVELGENRTWFVKVQQS